MPFPVVGNPVFVIPFVAIPFVATPFDATIFIDVTPIPAIPFATIPLVATPVATFPIFATPHCCSTSIHFADYPLIPLDANPSTLQYSANFPSLILSTTTHYGPLHSTKIPNSFPPYFKS
jgi:hypothetical protein